MKLLLALFSFSLIMSNTYGGLLNDLGIKIKFGKSVEEKSQEVYNDFAQFMHQDDSSIPLALIDSAECIMFIPNIIKVGFGIGGQSGVGIGTCRVGDSWSSPLFYRLSAASIGLNAGAQRMDLVLVFTDKKTGMATLTQENVTLGADSTLTLGPIGREAQVAININDAGAGPVFAYAKSEGLMLDLISAKGSIITPAKKLNRQAYGNVNSFGLPSNAQVELKENTPPRLLDFIENYLED